MGNSVLEVGEPVHIITRRLFDGDVRRHFTGRVTAAANDLVRAEGWVFVFNRGTNEFIRMITDGIDFAVDINEFGPAT